jgi:hypothetical protein
MPAPPPSALSIACTSVRDFLTANLQPGGATVLPVIGAPVDALPANAQAGDHFVNLFFYRIESSGFYPDTRPMDPWFMRLHCLVTAFATTEDNIPSGEIDLRILGDVIRVFHEAPVLGPFDIAGEQTVLQAVMIPISNEELHNIWSTQGDVTYRTSVCYEFALSPIVPSQPRRQSVPVEMIDWQTHADLDHRDAPFDAASGVRFLPPVRARTVDTQPADWLPAICFVQSSICVASLAFLATDPALPGFSARVWVAGDTSADVTLRWERWDTDGWTSVTPELVVQPITAGIDPDNLPAPASLASMALPDTATPGFWILFAERVFELPQGQPVTVRSNPLLLEVQAA